MTWSVPDLPAAEGEVMKLLLERAFSSIICLWLEQLFGVFKYAFRQSRLCLMQLLEHGQLLVELLLDVFELFTSSGNFLLSF
eukprot:1320057-Amphidinium_carterae.1